MKNILRLCQIMTYMLYRFHNKLMELDTGSGVFIIPKSDFDNYFKGCKLNVNVSEKNMFGRYYCIVILLLENFGENFEKMNVCSVIMARKSMKDK